MKAIDLTPIYKRYKGKWVVLDPSLRKVFAADTRLVNALKKFRQKYGEKTPYTTLRVPTEVLPFVGI